MIKKTIIKLLLVFMVTAFTAVVVVQWLWIKYAIEEKENKFTTQVYEVLNKTVNRVEEINYMKYLREMQHHLGTIQSYNELMAQENGPDAVGLSPGSLFDVLHNDMNRWSKERSYVSPMTAPGVPRSGAGKVVNQEFIMQTVRSLSFSSKDDKGTNYYGRFNEILRDFMLRVVKEKDPQNVDIQQRLEHIDLNALLVNYFQLHNIDVPFQYEILTKRDILNKVKTNNTANLYYVDLFPYDYVKKDYFLSVQFDSVQPVLFQNISWMFLASGFCVFGLLGVFIATILIIMRQQKLSVIKNDFINNMTHEFKTPLATISLATSAIMKDKVLNDKNQVVKFTEMIKSENHRMNKYVERILQQAKLDKKEFHLNKEEHSMNQIVREAVGHFILQVQNAGGELKLRLSDKDCQMNVDEVHIMNVVCNLIDNSIKYSVNAPDIKVTTHNSSKKFTITVEDKGMGIAKDNQRKVFKRFYRVPTGNVHNVKGFGLGLSYAKTIVEMHNGQILLSSKKDKGTTVEIVFEKK
ncbi:MAG: sensor histidine kinase [Marinifilaceae bacterium]